MKGKVVKTVDDKWAIEVQSDLYRSGTDEPFNWLVELALTPNDNIWIGKDVEVETVEYDAKTFLPSKAKVLQPTKGMNAEISKQINRLEEEQQRVKQFLNENGFDCTTAPYVIGKEYRDAIKKHIEVLRMNIEY
jgi:hypothetical protein